MHEMGETDISLFSLHSVSKGFLGECGHRGGYLEIRNIPDDVLAPVHQAAVDQPLRECQRPDRHVSDGGAARSPVTRATRRTSRERDAILASLKAKAEILGDGINAIAGMSVDMPQGAMYAFVRFELPPEQGVDAAAHDPGGAAAYEAGRDYDVLPGAAGGDGNLRRPRLRIRPAARDVPFPHDISSSAGGD